MNARQRAIRADSEGRCIQCGKAEGHRRRGLCNTDYMRFIKARNQLDESHVEEYEERLMDQGLLLPSRQGQRKPPADNIYATVAAEFQEKQRGKK